MVETGAPEVGKRIAIARRELGLTQKELAERIGVMLGAVDAYETGRADPSPHLERIAAATGKEAVWFLEGESPDDLAARLQRHAGALARRESAVRQLEESLIGVRMQTEARERELHELGSGLEERAAELERREDDLRSREAELARAEQKPREDAEALSRRREALERWERELVETRNRQAEAIRRLRARRAAAQELAEALQQRERERRVAQDEADLDKRKRALQDELRALVSARADVKQKLFALRDRVRAVVAQLEIQIAASADAEPREEEEPD